VRAMILAAGLGTRMRPLSDLCAKPALPVLGRPVIAWLLEWLHAQSVDEVLINLHYRADSVERAAQRFAPSGMALHWSHEPAPLGTGGGISRARAFLEASDPAVVLAGDMLLDVDLGALVSAHRASGADCTLVLRSDVRSQQFGTIGVDARGRVRRIATRFDLGGEIRAGVFVGLRILSPEAFRHLPDRPEGSAFEDLSDWLAPAHERGELDLRGHLLEPDEIVWEPVGTPAEYLAANLSPPIFSFFPPTRLVSQGTYTNVPGTDVVLGSGARVGAGAQLRRAVVWEDEQVPENFRGSGGVFAGGRFYVCEALPQTTSPQSGDQERLDE
jgi:mannose-1-phosphate guanylyltransferase